MAPISPNQAATPARIPAPSYSTLRPHAPSLPLSTSGAPPRRAANRSFRAFTQLWKARNRAIFENVQPNPIFTAIKASQALQEFSEVHSVADCEDDRRVCRDRGSANWVAPAEDMIKTNDDGAFKQPYAVGLGIIGRDCHGSLVFGFAKKLVCMSSLQAEATALRDALLWVQENAIDFCEIETDSKQLVDLGLLDQKPPPWAIEQLFDGH